MGIMEWGGLGALFLGIAFFCARIMRNGLTTLDEHRQQYLSHIREREKKIGEEKKTIGAAEQMLVMKAAVKDLLRLENKKCEISEKPSQISLKMPDGVWEIKLMMRERSLKSSNRVLHGRCRWILTGPQTVEEHMDHASVMRSLTRHINLEEEDDLPMPFKKRPTTRHDLGGSLDR